MLDYLPDEFGVLYIWTSINRTTLTQWNDHEVAYTLPDISKLIAEMQYTLLQSNNSIFLSREFTTFSYSCELKHFLVSPSDWNQTAYVSGKKLIFYKNHR